MSKEYRYSTIYSTQSEEVVPIKQIEKIQEEDVKFITEQGKQMSTLVDIINAFTIENSELKNYIKTNSDNLHISTGSNNSSSKNQAQHLSHYLCIQNIVLIIILILLFIVLFVKTS